MRASSCGRMPATSRRHWATCCARSSKRTQGLEIRILVWSIATLHAPGETLPLLIGAEWQDHPRIHLRLDREHPIYAAHHQKIVCIDDCLAFAGGIDLTVRRWDTPRHGADDPARLNPDGSPYGPVHDLQMVVDGAAARAVADLARLRWRHATGETLEPVGGDAKLWPDALEPDFRGASVAIARTAPPLGDRPPVREVAALTMDALRAARHSIYIEAQYFVSFTIGRLLARHLASDDGPDIVIVTSLTLPGAFERFVMGSNRDRLIRRMKRADRSDRLRVYHPVVPAEDGEREVLIHAKLIIVDDVFVRIGSSNLNNRSVGLDTECDLAIEARSDVQRQGVRRLRERLLGEHLGVSPAERGAGDRRQRLAGSRDRRAEPQRAEAAHVRGHDGARPGTADPGHLAARPVQAVRAALVSAQEEAQEAGETLPASARLIRARLPPALARAQEQLGEGEQEASEAQRRQEVGQAEHDQRADQLLPRQQEQNHALDHAEPAGHVADQRRDIGDHIDGGDAEIGDVRRGRERLVQAGRHEGEIHRADDRLPERQLQAWHFQRPLPEPQRPPNESRERQIGDRQQQAGDAERQDRPTVEPGDLLCQTGCSRSATPPRIIRPRPTVIAQKRMSFATSCALSPHCE